VTNEEYDELQNAVDDENGCIAACADKIDHLQAEIKRLTSPVFALKEAARRAHMYALKAEVKRLTTEKDSEGAEVIKLKAEIELLITRDDSHITSITERTYFIESLQTELAEARELLRAITAELGGALRAFEYELRDVLSNTNYNILAMKVAGNDAYLESHKEGE